MTVSHSLMFSLISAKSAWLGNREAVLARNVANSTTPGFRPMDLSPFQKSLSSIGAGAGRPGLAMTDPGHLPGVKRGAPPVGKAQLSGIYEMTPSGNAVSIEEELEKIGQTQMEHQLATSLYSKHVGMLRTATVGANG